MIKDFWGSHAKSALLHMKTIQLDIMVMIGEGNITTNLEFIIQSQITDFAEIAKHILSNWEALDWRQNTFDKPRTRPKDKLYLIDIDCRTYIYFSKDKSLLWSTLYVKIQTVQ